MTCAEPAIGIDHGTTTSAIAVMELDGPRVLKVDGLHEKVPSRAPPYKPQLGDGLRYVYNQGAVKSGVELGGRVIGELLDAGERELGVRPRRAVVTVPASFKAAAIDATRQAARLAGLERCPLLQEPIAAALSYGFTSSEKREQWLIVDLGGGTLDVSLVILRDGMPIVPEKGHGGDPDLGGADFDRQLMSLVHAKLSRVYSLENFARSHPRYSAAYDRLLAAVETAKIELSTVDQVTLHLEGSLCEDDHGKGVEVALEIRRAEYEEVIAANVERVVNICRRVLMRNDLEGADIQRLVLAGGVTKTPFVRDTLHTRLKIALETSLDPLTVVVRGAALHAQAHLNSDVMGLVSSTSTSGAISISLTHEPVSREPVLPVFVRVEGVGQGAQLSCELTRAGGGWSRTQRFGWGAGETPELEVEVELELATSSAPRANLFHTRVFDLSGREVASAEGPCVWHPFPLANARLARSLRIAVRGDTTRVLVPAGAPLPCKTSVKIALRDSLEPRSNAELFRGVLMEGHPTLLGEEEDAADCCAPVAMLHVRAPAGDRPISDEAQIEIEAHLDHSRSLVLRAILLDRGACDDVAVSLDSSQPKRPSVPELAVRVDSLRKQLAELTAAEKQPAGSAAAEVLASIHNLAVFDSLRRELADALRGDQAASIRADRRTRELAGTLHAAHRLQTPARLRSQAHELAALPWLEPEQQQLCAQIILAFHTDPTATSSAELERWERRLTEMETTLHVRCAEVLRASFQRLPGHITGDGEQVSAARRAQQLLFDSERVASERGNIPRETLLEMWKAHRRLIDLFPQLAEQREGFRGNSKKGDEL